MTEELCKRCGKERKEWEIGTVGYVKNFCYFYLCKDCSRELDRVEKENPNEKGGVVGLCTWGNIRFVTWVKTGKIMPYDEAIKLLNSGIKYHEELERLRNLPIFKKVEGK